MADAERRSRLVVQLRGWKVELGAAPYWLGVHWWPRAYGRGLIWDIGLLFVEVMPPVERPEAGWCPECGPNVAVDEDGLCATCGATATGEGADAALAALANADVKEGSHGR